MNKLELEKMFDDEFLELYIHIKNKKYGGVYSNELKKLVGTTKTTQTNRKKSIEVKQFIFETIIPEVLKSIIKSNNQDEEGNGYINSCVETVIKQKAKEQFGIDL